MKWHTVKCFFILLLLVTSCTHKNKNIHKINKTTPYLSQFNCNIESDKEETFKKTFISLGMSPDTYDQEHILNEKIENTKLTNDDKKLIFEQLEKNEDALNTINETLSENHGIWSLCSYPDIYTTNFYSKKIPELQLCSCPNKTDDDFTYIYCPTNSSFTMHLSSYQYMAISNYTTSLYLKINKALRSNNKESICRIYPIAIEIETGLQQLIPFKGKVFRGAILPKSVDRQYQEGEIVSDRGFMSTSKSLDIAKHFAGSSKDGWIFEIYLKQKCRDIESLSQGEKEVLCPPGTKIKIIKRNDIDKTMIMEEVVE